ncbi:cation diffusion facilitator family transporter [Ferrovibrio xuzhouensis]|uniref:Cation diffusion facilitator family transporter n=1 Tax=Ferrovibrio xuzhouensis TaxID=1576914 RepID=A0ABV7VEE4_9PROT
MSSESHHKHDHKSHDHGVHAHGSHGHGHSHAGHAHAPASFGRAFAIGITLNVAFVAIEAAYGILANSMALLADAGHNLSDVLGLVIAWIAAILSRRPPSSRYTYGLRSSSILAALFNAIFLLLAVGAIGWEAIQRLASPEPVAGTTVIVVAAIGIAINGFTAWLFMAGSKGDLNIRGAYLHMAADAAVSAGVVLAGIAILFTGWLWLDPVVSIVIVLVIVWGTWGLLRESVAMSLDAVPSGISLEAVQAYLAGIPGVTEVHDLHIWSMSTTEVALTAHLVRPGLPVDDRLIAETSAALEQRFGIHHSTIQLESGDTQCTFAPAHRV